VASHVFRTSDDKGAGIYDGMILNDACDVIETPGGGNGAWLQAEPVSTQAGGSCECPGGVAEMGVYLIS
jgi:hypothetical protein